MSPRAKGFALWVAALVLMLAAAAYQERTGPTYPVEGTLEVAGVARGYSLPRTEITGTSLRIALPDPGEGSAGSVVWRRYPTDEPFTTTPMRRDTVAAGGAELVAELPSQPPAGKLEYRVEVKAPGGVLRIPSEAAAAAGEGMIVARYKDPVPLPLLIAHVTCMFLAMLVGMRAALAALAHPAGIGRLPWIALALMTAGGLILGPFVQKYAFGAFWTGFPHGYDLTDNKTLIMWLVWAVVCGVLWKGRARAPVPRLTRATVLAAALVMTAVYLIPHSLKGSQLDYGKLDQGAPASQAVHSGV
jgi:hypothetical protein